MDKIKSLLVAEICRGGVLRLVIFMNVATAIIVSVYANSRYERCVALMHVQYQP